MVSDDPNKQHDEDRERLLDEIRRRAEEAELKRIEEEDRSTGHSPEHPHDDEASSPFPTLPPPYPSSPSYEAEKEQRAMILRERLSIALDRRNLDNAREIFAELELLDPFDPDLTGFRNRMAEVAEHAREPEPEAESAPEQSTQVSQAESPPDSGPFSSDEPALTAEFPPVSEESPVRSQPPPSRREAGEDVTSLYDAAVSLYEQEKYEQAMTKLDRLLLLDGGNEEALALHQQIERAWKLAELIKEEEKKHKAAQPPPAPVEQPAIPKGGKDSDFWGPTEIQKSDDETIVVPSAPAARRQQPPLLDRAVARVSKVHIPIRPLLTVLGILVVVYVGYRVVDAVMNAVVPPERVICVFPPTLLEGGTAEQGMVDAFAADLIGDLGSVPSVQVLATPTVLATRGRSARPTRLAQSFGAGYYVLWTASIRGDEFSGAITLMDTLKSTPVWKTTLESSLENLPHRRLELARNILQAMEVGLPEADHPLASAPPSTPRTGYGSYLRARAAMQSGASDAVDQAMAAFRHAVREDSTDGDAWAALGWTYILESERASVPDKSRLPAALACVERAISLGAPKAEAFRTWGLVEQMNGQYAKAASRLQEAVKRSPSDAEALRRLAIVLTLLGETEDALQAALAAAEVDPLNASSQVTAGLVYQFRGEFPEAELRYRRALQEDREHPDALELHAEVLVYMQRADDALAQMGDVVARVRSDPAAYYRLGRIAQTAGRPKQEWMSAFEQARVLLEGQLRVKPDSAMALSLLALTQTRLGAFRDAMAAQSRALELAPRDVGILYNAARMYALQRDKEQAMKYLIQAVDLRYDLRRIVDMDLFNLRSDEEFLRSVTRQ